MAKKSLKVREVYVKDFHLIGIHTDVENYRLAYLINSISHLNLEKSNYCIKVSKDNTDCSFLVYEYIDDKFECEWLLIENKSNHKEKSLNHYLVPELSKMNYVIKVDSHIQHELIKELICEIQKIPQNIIPCFVDITKIKSKEILMI